MAKVIVFESTEWCMVSSTRKKYIIIPPRLANYFTGVWNALRYLLNRIKLEII